MDRGYFPVYRKIFDSDVWGHKVARIVWIYILGHVSFEPSKTCIRYKCVELGPGEMIAGRDMLSEKCRLSPKMIRNSINYLKTTNRITTKTTNRFTIISVINWQAYRDAQLGEGQQKGQQEGQQRASRGPHIRSKEVKKEQNPIAVALYDFYSENIIRVPAKRSDAIRNITKLLDSGHTKEDLAGAVEDYANSNFGDKPFHPNNFFGQKEYYRGFGKYAK